MGQLKLPAFLKKLSAALNITFLALLEMARPGTSRSEIVHPCESYDDDGDAEADSMILDSGQRSAAAAAAALHSQQHRVSYKALICQRTTAVCCYAVDRILRLPRPSSTRPQVNSYRRSWHNLAGLLGCLIVLTLGQSCLSAVGFTCCVRQLGGCVPFLERDPCLKAAVPFFVVSLVWLSVLCSCCCQSPKALSVFLLVGLCGEAVLASYMVAFDQSVRIDDHLRTHLTGALESACSQAGDVDHEGSAMRCFAPFRGRLSGCRRLDARSMALCNGTRGREQSAVLLRKLASSCVAEVLTAISDRKALYQSLTYSLLYLFAVAHLVIAIAMCAYDVRRKSIEKSLGRDSLGATSTALTPAAAGVAAEPSATANNGQQETSLMKRSEILVNLRAAEKHQQQQQKLRHQQKRHQPRRERDETEAEAADAAAASRVTFDLDKRM